MTARLLQNVLFQAVNFRILGAGCCGGEHDSISIDSESMIVPAAVSAFLLIDCARSGQSFSLRACFVFLLLMTMHACT
jgi:hypothetical protein